MVGVLLFFMYNVGIHRTHRTIYQNVLIGNNHEKKNQRAQKTYSECQNFKANGVWPIMTHRWPMKTLCECDKTSLSGFAHKISTNVDVARKLTSHLVFTHGNTSEIVFIDLSWFGLLMIQIA